MHSPNFTTYTSSLNILVLNGRLEAERQSPSSFGSSINHILCVAREHFDQERKETANGLHQYNGLPLYRIWGVLQADNMEVLAHITAPSGFQDDKKYRAQAAAISQFESCTKLTVYGHDAYDFVEDGECLSAATEDTAFDTSLSFSTWCEIDVVGETPAQQEARQLLNQKSPRRLPERIIAAEDTAGTRADSQPSITGQVTRNKAVCHSPAYKIPSFRHSKPTPAVIHAARTPEVPRPKTAPTGSVTFDSKALRKRAHSELSSFDSSRNIVPDSQKKGRLAVLKEQLHTFVQNRKSKGRLSDSTTSTTTPQRPIKHQLRPAKRHKANRGMSPGGPLATPGLAQLKDIPGGPSETPSLAQLKDIPTISPDPTPEPRQPSHDSTDQAPTCTIPTAEWLPKPRSNMTYPPRPTQFYSTQLHHSAFHNMPAPSPSAALPSDWHFSQIHHQPATTETPLPNNPTNQPFTSLSTLPTAIHSPPPPAAHAQYTTHLTTPLRILATRLPLSTSFRPILVSRDIKALERGYWYLRVAITAKPTSPPTKGAVTNDEYRTGAERCWIADAFLQTWHALAAFIESGAAGWGVSLYREDPSPMDQSSESGGTVDGGVVIKVACWGEMIAHIYLIMWVLSEKRLGGMGMEWRDGGGEVVVRMGMGVKGGERQKPRGMGRYGYKGGEGVEGRWGIIREGV